MTNKLWSLPTVLKDTALYNAVLGGFRFCSCFPTTTLLKTGAYLIYKKQGNGNYN